MNVDRLKQIRESEQKSHIEMYSKNELFQEGSWLRKPIKTILDLLPEFKKHKELRVLELGCGVGRNCIAVAKEYTDIPCIIDCVDILEIAIEKLYQNAREYGVESNINGVVQPIEDFEIAENTYDFIIAVSALEHIDSKEMFMQKLAEINLGMREQGIVCLVVNSSVKENDKATGEVIPAQFEVNLPTEELQRLLEQSFAGWKLMKTMMKKQQYDIPREGGISDLKTTVVTFVARKVDMKQ